MGVETAIITAGALGAAGSILGSNSQADAAKSLANAPVKIPSDIAGLRASLSSQLAQATGDGIPGSEGSLVDAEGVDQLLQNLLLYSSPEFAAQIGAMFDPQAIIGAQREAGLPVLQEQLALQQGQNAAALNLSGNRFSTDAARIFAESGANALNEFELGLAGQLPQLTAVQAGALGSIPTGLAGAAATGIGAALAPAQFEFAQRRFPFEMALPFSTAGVGGTASASLAPYMGQSGIGSALGTLGNVASLYPLLSAGLGGPSPTIVS